MSRSSRPDRAWTESYIRQLIQLRDERALFLNAYFPEPGSRRSHMEKLLSTYTGALDRLLNGAADNRHDIVLIGCSVTVTYVEDGITDTFSIVFPEEADPERNRISFFSPIAEQLLLRAQGDVLPIETNMEVLHVRIDAIMPGTDGAGEQEKAYG